MSVWKNISGETLSYEPDGVGSREEIPVGEEFILENKKDYIVGTQIHPSQVELVKKTKK